jgi:hypothetical protein
MLPLFTRNNERAQAGMQNFAAKHRLHHALGDTTLMFSAPDQLLSIERVRVTARQAGCRVSPLR